MDYINDIIIEKSKLGIILNEKDIVEILYLLKEHFYLENYFKYVYVSNDKTLFLARTDMQSNALILNINLILTSAYKKMSLVNQDYYSNILFINLFIYEIMLHEIKHFQQHKLIKEGNDSESLILEKSNLLELKLKNNNMYDLLSYHTNPIERQAEIYSLKIISKILASLNQLEDSIFKLRYDAKILEFYDKTNSLYPLKTYIDYNNRYLEALQLDNINKSIMSKNDINLSKKIELGMKI